MLLGWEGGGGGRLLEMALLMEGIRYSEHVDLLNMLKKPVVGTTVKYNLLVSYN